MAIIDLNIYDLNRDELIETTGGTWLSYAFGWLCAVADNVAHALEDTPDVIVDRMWR